MSETAAALVRFAELSCDFAEVQHLRATYQRQRTLAVWISALSTVLFALNIALHSAQLTRLGWAVFAVALGLLAQSVIAIERLLRRAQKIMEEMKGIEARLHA